MPTFKENRQHAIDLMKRQSEISVRLGAKLALVMLQESKKTEMMKPLKDGSISPEDHELITGHLMTFLTKASSFGSSALSNGARK